MVYHGAADGVLIYVNHRHHAYYGDASWWWAILWNRCNNYYIIVIYNSCGDIIYGDGDLLLCTWAAGHHTIVIASMMLGRPTGDEKVLYIFSS